MKIKITTKNKTIFKILGKIPFVIPIFNIRLAKFSEPGDMLGLPKYKEKSEKPILSYTDLVKKTLKEDKK